MPRKKSETLTETNPETIKFREKRKWQIALRRYVLERNISSFYAPYFGLDIENLRNWFEVQFNPGIGWEDFAKKWQFDHIIPITHFDFSNEDELKLCWNFTNIRVAHLQRSTGTGNRLDTVAARGYFEELYDKTLYIPCLKLLNKLEKIEISQKISSDKQQLFIIKNRNYMDMIENYSALEFELLNSGRSINEVKKEIEFLKKFGK